MAKVVEAVASSSASKNKELSPILEAAMDAEVKKCYAEGVMDPEVIRARKLAAKEQAKHDYFAKREE